MSSNPRIVVFKLKELIYTGIFVVLGILLIVLFINMFKSDKKDKPSASQGEVNALAENPITTDTPKADEAGSINSSDTGSSTDDSSANGSSANNSPTDDSSKDTSANKTSNNTSNDKNSDTSSKSETTYTPGVYTSSLMLNNSSLEIEVCVDTHKINSISITNMDEAITTMYPLMENSMNDLANQIINSQSLENIKYTDDCKYTYMILLDAISTTLDKAKPVS